MPIWKPRHGAQDQNVLRISPLVRARILFKHDIDIDHELNGGKTYDDAFLIRTIGQFERVERIRDRLLLIILIIDITLFHSLLGGGFTLPIIRIDLREIPLWVELAAFVSSYCYLFFALGFINWLTYDALLDQMFDRKSHGSVLDYEVIKSSYTLFQFVVKIFRTNFHVYKADATPSLPFKALHTIIILSVLAVLMVLLFWHIAIIYQATDFIISSDKYYLVGAAYLAFIWIVNGIATLALILVHVPFKFALPVSNNESAPAKPEPD